MTDAMHRLLSTMPNLVDLTLDVRGTPGSDDQWLAHILHHTTGRHDPPHSLTTRHRTGLTSLSLRLDPGGPPFHPACLQWLPHLRELRHRGDVMDGEHLAALWVHPPLQHAWVEVWPVERNTRVLLECLHHVLVISCATRVVHTFLTPQVNLQNLRDFVQHTDPDSQGAALHLKLWFSGHLTHSFLRLLVDVLPDMPRNCCHDFYTARTASHTMTLLGTHGCIHTHMYPCTIQQRVRCVTFDMHIPRVAHSAQ